MVEITPELRSRIRRASHHAFTQGRKLSGYHAEQQTADYVEALLAHSIAGEIDRATRVEAPRELQDRPPVGLSQELRDAIFLVARRAGMTNTYSRAEKEQAAERALAEFEEIILVATRKPHRPD